MPAEKPSTIRKCAVCNEWTPVNETGCVHCNRAKGIYRKPASAATSKISSPSGGCIGAIATILAILAIGLSKCAGKSSDSSSSAVSAASSQSTDWNNDPVTILSAAEINVKNNLKDPDSARFRGLFVSKLDNGSYALCGKVNSKNSFGGYTGFIRFIASVNPDAPTIIEGNPTGYGEEVDRKIFPAAYAKFCGNVYRRFDEITK